jgi:hypothetical protein
VKYLEGYQGAHEPHIGKPAAERWWMLVHYGVSRRFWHSLLRPIFSLETHFVSIQARSEFEGKSPWDEWNNEFSKSTHSVKVTTHLKLLYIPNRTDLSGLHTPSRSSFTSELPALQPSTDIFGRVLITDEINFSHYSACQQPVQSAKCTSNGTPRISYSYRNVRWAAAKTDF